MPPAMTPLLNRHLRPGDRYDPSCGGVANLTAAWARHWRAAPDAHQIHDPVRGWIRRGELDSGSALGAGRLERLGLREGERVLLSAESSAALVLAYLACLRLGLVVIPTNTAYGPRELEHVIRDARPRAVILDDAERLENVRAIDDSIHLLTPALDIPDGRVPPLDRVSADSPALLCYTSGTTGQPKGAVLSHAHCLASAEALRLAWRWEASDRLILALPLFHMHGLGVGLHGTLFTGGSAVLLTGFRADEILTSIEEHEASLFFGVPTMYHRLVSQPEAERLSRLRLCVSGSAPLPATLHEEIEKRTGQSVLERYGMTETLMLVSNPVSAQRRPGTVGWPLPGVELRLEGEPAEIQVRGPNVFDGYWERPEANRTSFTRDGWFRTGDLGAVDADGYLRIVGRAKELIISGGFNVYPREVEDALRAHPDIEDVAVIGEPSDEWGERVVAYAVLLAPLDLEALRTFLGPSLAGYKHPRALHRVDALPRNALGKVQKHRLERGVVLPD